MDKTALPPCPPRVSLLKFDQMSIAITRQG